MWSTTILGPEGNYLGDFGPYFTDQYRSPWGQAINFDGPDSDEVVRFFIENALYWLRDFHIRCPSPGCDPRNCGLQRASLPPVAGPGSARVRRDSRGRKIYLIAESDLNDVRFIQPAESGGYGLDAQWSDDFHHASIRCLRASSPATTWISESSSISKKPSKEGFVYSGQYSAYRRRRHGNSSVNLPARQFVVFSQNHDQVGNRLCGDRLSSSVSFEALKLAAGMVILSPYIPLLFMGEEWGERAPFQYFTSHSDAAFDRGGAARPPRGVCRLPLARGTLRPARRGNLLAQQLDHNLRHTEPHRTLWSSIRN